MPRIYISDIPRRCWCCQSWDTLRAPALQKAEERSSHGSLELDAEWNIASCCCLHDRLCPLSFAVAWLSWFLLISFLHPFIYILKGSSGSKNKTLRIYKVLIGPTFRGMVLFFHYNLNLKVNVCQGTTLLYTHPEICRSFISWYLLTGTMVPHVPGICWPLVARDAIPFPILVFTN